MGGIPRIPSLLLPIFFLSGMCALVYELLWTRWLGLILGNFIAATSVVLAVFMAGLAIGSALLGRAVARKTPAGAVRLYAFLEAGLAILAALSPLLLSTSSGLYPKLAHAMPLLPVRVSICAVLLLAPTILMGGTLPALVRALAAARPRLLGPLYAVNTAGAALGPLLAVFVLMPALGLVRALLVTSALNAFLAAGAYWLSFRWPVGEQSREAESVPQNAEIPTMWWLAYLLALISGMLALASEVALTRRIQLIVTGGSVYGLAIVLSAFLVGMSAGASIARRIPPRGPRAALLAYAVALGGVYVFSLTTPFWDLLPTALVRLWASSEAFTPRMSLNYAVVFALLLIPAASFGYALPVLSGALVSPGAGSIGGLFAANTIGATLGALLTGFFLLPGWGQSRSLLAIGGAALAASAAAAFFGQTGGRRWTFAVAAPFGLGLLFILPRPDPMVMNSGAYNRPGLYMPGSLSIAGTPREMMYLQGKVIFEGDGYLGHIAVRAAGPKSIAFIVNGKPDGSTSPGDMLTQVLSAHLGLLLHPDPRRILVIGLGTGISAGSVSLHPDVQELHVAEIEPLQLEVTKIFARHNYNVLEYPRLKMHLDDARHVLLTQDGKFDAVLSEPSNLFVSGMVNLYTREFFSLVRERLTPDGVFLVFVHYYQVREQDLKGVFRTFQSVFPSASCWLHGGGDCFLIGTKNDLRIDIPDWERRMQNKWIAADLRRIEIRSPMDVMGYYLWGPQELAEYAGSARICTDDFPYLEFASGRIPWGAHVSDANRAALLGAPAEVPVPLQNETAGLRVKLSVAFMGRGRLARARTELSRALGLDPAVPGGRQALARLEEFRSIAPQK